MQPTNKYGKMTIGIVYGSIAGLILVMLVLAMIARFFDKWLMKQQSKWMRGRNTGGGEKNIEGVYGESEEDKKETEGEEEEEGGSEVRQEAEEKLWNEKQEWIDKDAIDACGFRANLLKNKSGANQWEKIGGEDVKW